MTTQNPLVEETPLHMDFVDHDSLAGQGAAAGYKLQRNHRHCTACHAKAARTAVYCSSCGKRLLNYEDVIKFVLVLVGGILVCTAVYLFWTGTFTAAPHH